MPEERDVHVTAYLDSFSPSERNERIECCGASRALFCPFCCKLLAPQNDLPPCVRDQSLKLPFHLHVVLDDERRTATGLHAMALLGGEQVSLTDLKQGDDQTVDLDSHTYVLFPCHDSVPLSSVGDISTLVVLDCKWTKTGPAKLCVNKLPRVHLTHPPQQSHFWRSHTAQQGCLSTIEAIYHAALERDPDDSSLIHLLWLFGKQRAAIQAQGPWKGRSMPYTEEAKQVMRTMRIQKNIDNVSI